MTDTVDTTSDAGVSMTEPSIQMRDAAERRAEAASSSNGDMASRLQVPGGAARMVDTSWLKRGDQPMPPRLRAKKVDKDGKQFYLVEGYYTVYERGYEMWDFFGPYMEVVSAGAGDETTAANPDVVFLVNHRGLAMARTHVAGTLELWSDEIGGGDRAWLNPARSDVKDLVLNIEDGVTTEQSFAFMITSGRWSPDYMEYRIDKYDIDRGDTSAVNYGANPYTSIAARSREILDALDQLPVGVARAALERLNHRADLTQMTSVPAQMTPTRSTADESSTVDRTPLADAWRSWIEMAEAGK